MEYVQLGKSDITVSRIGFGCMSLQDGHEGNENILNQALDQGLNYFDTADLYDKGRNEELIGRTFKNKRDKVIIASKAGNQWRRDGSGWDWNPRKDYILQCADESLRRLQTDYIDLYQLHGGTINDPIDETIEAFEILLQQGKIRYYGISSIRPNVIREWINRSRIVSVMMQYSLLDRRPEETCLPLLQENNIAVLARGPVAQGLLAGKPAKEYLEHTEEEVEKTYEKLVDISGSKRTTAQSAVQYVLGHPAITSAVVGIRTMQQLQQALTIPALAPMNATELGSLRSFAKPIVYKDHR